MGRHFTKDEIQRMPTTDLAAIVTSTVPTGEYAAEVVWARAELEHRHYPASKLLNNLTDIARYLAIEAVASGMDIGDLYDDAWDLSDDQWARVSKIVSDVMPEIERTFPTEVARSRKAWAQADRDIRAEQRAERIAFSLDA